ncbi:hypothetical protein ECHHL_0288 [Ehrlichia chaffeensis str. Heartland]|uniref:Uncharacterized protein n=1 Tax=Ehrlichia chaffeensis (strain ATCC CRL-10679 / Arkansas) TaxID=205920 RepID=Q2GHC5_EHRCR|nr:hypothetical protein ECH_0338 [Ehrlichia chaffeensis str. Arkansas]AHX03453.1 hypothetical protein ECHHL_0288 [Ehrlichia chaffeensis str. Heartland]AHX05827.1 hypothetical protein ECHJAX_0770 [Ehrlichia chaffeensis str. Jax]AHX06819.1 hypothetical protein ECHLIB_0774 [Ehrlichia chaffeensis str. Liberty]AHX08304.1 hypothetical protein ECHSTV_0758 [Ehrlichia chaffeensis str. Saint Vincent]AHX09312.1 hypothetical protein ECHWAK_0767 [Ehrlichia chaffeensis str. Wakulla]AHX10832.1 hypothetical 
MFDKLMIIVINFYYMFKIYRLKITNFIYWLLIINVYSSIIKCTYIEYTVFCGVSSVL